MNFGHVLLYGLLWIGVAVSVWIVGWLLANGATQGFYAACQSIAKQQEKAKAKK